METEETPMEVDVKSNPPTQQMKHLHIVATSPPAFDPSMPSTSSQMPMQMPLPQQIPLGYPTMSTPPPAAATSLFYPSASGSPLSRPPSQYSLGSPFRAQNGGDRRVQQLRETAIGRQVYLNNWMLDHGQLGGNAPPPGAVNYGPPRSRPASLVGSTMSTCASVYSMGGLSEMSQLSVNTELANSPYAYGYIHHPNALSTVSASSSTENENPNAARQVEKIVDMAIRVLDGDDWDSKLNVMRTQIYPLSVGQVKITGEIKLASAHKDKLDMLFGRMFQMLKMQEMPESETVETTISYTLHALYHAIQRGRTCISIIEKIHCRWKQRDGVGVFMVIVGRARQMHARYANKAWMLLSSLCSTSKIRRDVQQDGNIFHAIVRFIVEQLQQPQGLAAKNLATGCLRVLVSKGREKWAINFNQLKFIASNYGAIEVLVHILQNDVTSEPLLLGAAHALDEFVLNTDCGARFIVCGGVQVMCKLLSHGSTRLLHQLLHCLCRVADLPQLGNQDLHESLGCVLQLLGAADPVIAERATGFLINFSANNPGNKMVLVHFNTPNTMFDLLNLADKFVDPTGNPQAARSLKESVQNINEHCLQILNNLTKQGPGDFPQAVADARKMISMHPFSPNRLLNFIGCGDKRQRKRGILVLQRVIDTVPSYATLFLDARGLRDGFLPRILLERIWESFGKFVKNRGVGGSGDSEQRERRCLEHEEIAQLAIRLLDTLMGAHENFPRIVCDFLERFGDANPLRLPVQYRTSVSEKMLNAWLRFLGKLFGSTRERAELLARLADAVPESPDALRKLAEDPRFQEPALTLLQMITTMQRR